jgi:hypothetical protein
MTTSPGQGTSELPGRRIIAWSWWADVAFAATAIPVAVGISGFDEVAVGTALALFAASLVVWVLAFSRAAVRSAEGDDIVVGSMFFTVGGASRDTRRQLFGALAACVVVAFATAWANPFGVLVPMLPLGFVGLWAARHGAFPPRPTGAWSDRGREGDGRR